MDYAERYVVELEDGTFALFGQFVEGEAQSILTMEEFYNGTLFRKEFAEIKMEQINQGAWKFLGETKKAKGIRKIQMKLI